MYSVHLLFEVVEDARFIRYILFPYGPYHVVRTICHSRQIKEARTIKDLSQRRKPERSESMHMGVYLPMYLFTYLA